MQQRQILKEYAFCQCVNQGFEDRRFFDDDISMSFYNELSLYSKIAQMKVDSVSKLTAKSILLSSHLDYKGKKAVIYTCMQFYKSTLLDSLVKTLDAEIMQ